MIIPTTTTAIFSVIRTITAIQILKRQLKTVMKKRKSNILLLTIIKHCHV